MESGQPVRVFIWRSVDVVDREVGRVEWGCVEEREEGEREEGREEREEEDREEGMEEEEDQKPPPPWPRRRR